MHICGAAGYSYANGTIAILIFDLSVSLSTHSGGQFVKRSDVQSLA